MDPIHPIIPRQPSIPPIAASPRVDRTGERRRDGGGRQQPRRERPQHEPDEVDDDDSGEHRHIDVTA